MFKFIFASFLILTLRLKTCNSQYYINYEHQDHCKYLYNDKIWLEKQLEYNYEYYYHYEYNKNYEILRNELDQYRKEISQMLIQLCEEFPLGS